MKSLFSRSTHLAMSVTRNKVRTVHSQAAWPIADKQFSGDCCRNRFAPPSTRRTACSPSLISVAFTLSMLCLKCAFLFLYCNPPADVGILAANKAQAVAVTVTLWVSMPRTGPTRSTSTTKAKVPTKRTHPCCVCTRYNGTHIHTFVCEGYLQRFRTLCATQGSGSTTSITQRTGQMVHGTPPAATRAKGEHCADRHDRFSEVVRKVSCVVTGPSSPIDAANSGSDRLSSRVQQLCILQRNGDTNTTPRPWREFSIRTTF